MTIKEELQNLRFISKNIDSKIRQCSNLKKYYTTIQSQDYSKEKCKTNLNKDFTDTVVKIIDLEREITSDIDELVDKKREIENKIKVLQGIDYLVIQLRYFEELKWEEIALKLNYDYRYVLKIHGNALQKLNKNEKRH